MSMDQDSERDFDWKITEGYLHEGYEDDIIQEIQAGNTSLSLPSTKYAILGKKSGPFWNKRNIKTWTS